MVYYVCSVPRIKSSVLKVLLINLFKVNGVAFRGETGTCMQASADLQCSGEFSSCLTYFLE